MSLALPLAGSLRYTDTASDPQLHFQSWGVLCELKEAWGNTTTTFDITTHPGKSSDHYLFHSTGKETEAQGG